jgi:hypothetical protein
MAEKARRKISVKNEKLSDKPAGFSFQGKYVGQAKSAPFTDDDGEEKQLTSVIMEAAGGERTAYLADKGLLQTLSEALVKEGDMIEVVKGEKVSIGKGRTMNTYEVFAI